MEKVKREKVTAVLDQLELYRQVWSDIKEHVYTCSLVAHYQKRGHPSYVTYDNWWYELFNVNPIPVTDESDILQTWLLDECLFRHPDFNRTNYENEVLCKSYKLKAMMLAGKTAALGIDDEKFKLLNEAGCFVYGKNQMLFYPEVTRINHDLSSVVELTDLKEIEMSRQDMHILLRLSKELPKAIKSAEEFYSTYIA